MTLIYGGLFLACGAGLLAITYALVARADVLPNTAFVTRPPGFVIQQALRSPRRGTAAVPPGAVRRVGSGGPNFQVLPPAIRKALRSSAGKRAIDVVLNTQHHQDLHQLEIESAIALAIMTLISGLLGWLVAGRILRPLRTITATTRELSEASLDRRLALAGPPDEPRLLADTIDGLLARLEAAFEAQRRFVANASHELRTPLTTVRALLEMVMSDPDADVAIFRETSRQVLEENEYEERLIDALLALAQGQRGTDRGEPTDLSAVARGVIEAREADAVARGVTLETALDPAAIVADRRLVERLVSNLVENAIRHNIPQGTVTVSVLSIDAGQAVLNVGNTGPVVPEDQVERLLQPFQRLTQERIGADGLGLGLSIVAAIATAHHATLDITPRAEGGLEVRVRFPIALEAPALTPEPTPSFV